MARSHRRSFARYAAPAAFVLAATVLALLIHSALGGKGILPRQQTTTVLGPVTRPSTAPRADRHDAHDHEQPHVLDEHDRGHRRGAEYATVQSGDTFFSIASRNGTTVAEIEGLNPGVSSNSLQVGQQIRVK